jgi:hypothetical protein
VGVVNAVHSQVTSYPLLVPGGHLSVDNEGGVIVRLGGIMSLNGSLGLSSAAAKFILVEKSSVSAISILGIFIEVSSSIRSGIFSLSCFSFLIDVVH